MTDMEGMDFTKSGQEGGRYLKAVRMETFRMTQDAFAELLGVSVSTLRNWEAGTNPVPAYVLRSVRVMAGDPTRALMDLRTGICVDGGDGSGWESGHPWSRVRREDAVEWMKQVPERVQAMELVDGLLDFTDHYRALGCPALSTTQDVLLLAMYMELRKISGRLDEMQEKAGEKWREAHGAT